HLLLSESNQLKGRQVWTLLSSESPFLPCAIFSISQLNVHNSVHKIGIPHFHTQSDTTIQQTLFPQFIKWHLFALSQDPYNATLPTSQSLNPAEYLCTQHPHARP
ncbi:unnamed protein product, partial [Choristocarpus tenellus]